VVALAEYADHRSPLSDLTVDRLAAFDFTGPACTPPQQVQHPAETHIIEDLPMDDHKHSKEGTVSKFLPPVAVDARKDVISLIDLEGKEFTELKLPEHQVIGPVGTLVRFSAHILLNPEEWKSEYVEHRKANLPVSFLRENRGKHLELRYQVKEDDTATTSQVLKLHIAG
jgi:hypothetical protein